MTNTNANDRARLAEDDYFRRRDAELIEQAMQAREQASAEGALALETRELSGALGVHDAGLVGTLHAAGFRAGITALLDWLPAIDVAWVDDLDLRERHELRVLMAADPRAETRSLTLMTEFLFIPPSETLMEAAREVLRRQLAAMDPAARRTRLTAIVERSEAVAVASGGIWILGAVSGDERRRIVAIRTGLGEPEPDLLAGAPEFPH